MIPLVHHQDQVAVLNVSVLLDEECAIVIEAPVVAWTPNVVIQGIEIVAEPQVECVGVLVPIIRLDVVVAGVPRHGRVVAITAPVIPHWRPKVHVEQTPLVHVAHGLIRV